MKTLESPEQAKNLEAIKTSDFQKNIGIVARGGGITFFGKLFNNVIRIGLAIALARILGSVQLGYYNLALSALNISVGISLLGLDAAIVRYIAIKTSRDDEQGTWEAIQIGVGVSLILSTITGISLYAFSFHVAENYFNNPQLAPYLQLISVFVPLLVIFDQASNALKGFKKFNSSVLAQYVLRPVTRLVLIGILFLVGLNARTAIVSYGLASLTATGAMFYYLNKDFPLKRTIKVSFEVLKEMLVFSIPVWMSSLLAKFRGNITILFIGSLNTIAGVGVFSVARQITEVSGEFSSAINATSKPIVAELYDRGDIRQMERIYQLANKWVVIAQMPIFLIIVLFPAEILSIFGEEYIGGSLALIILAIGNLIMVGTGMGGIIIDMTGYTKLKLMNSVLRLAIFIALDLLLIPKWGLVGAAIAILGGEGFLNILRLVEVYIIYKIIPYNRSFIKPIYATFVAASIVVLTTNYWLTDASFLTTVLNISIMLLFYVWAIFLLGFSEEELSLFKTLVSNLKFRLNQFSGNGK